MSKKNKLDITCPYCGRKHSLEDLKERLYVDETKVGLCITCPKCEAQWIKSE